MQLKWYPNIKLKNRSSTSNTNSYITYGQGKLRVEQKNENVMSIQPKRAKEFQCFVYSLYQMFVHCKMTKHHKSQWAGYMFTMHQFHHVCLCKITTKAKYHRWSKWSKKLTLIHFFKIIILCLSMKNIIKPRNCVSVILSGLCSMNLYLSPEIVTLMIWYYRATALEHVW